MLNENRLIGALGIYRQEVRPFTDKQIELVQTFANQAVIAIENTRLLNELRESLQQQTATADVLKVISRSTFDLQAVLNTLTESAAHLCEADMAAIARQKGDTYYLVSVYGYPPDVINYVKTIPHERGRGSVVGRTVLTATTVHVTDVLADPEYTNLDMQQKLGCRTVLGVPLLREGNPIGVISLLRNAVRPFTEKQVELVRIFADQAVIAIENARLLNELRESLQQQTATADVLKVISRSTFDLKSVLSTLVESAARLCEADMAALARPKGSIYGYDATFGHSREHEEFLSAHPAGIDRGTAVGRTLVEGKIVHITDVLADPEYKYLEGQKLGGFRTLLGVPLLREGTPIGVIVVQRKTVRPFTEKQMELVTTFADQAVIAIENVHLFDEVQARTRDLSEALEQQTATSEVLEIISSTPGELMPVFETMLANATRLCEAKFGHLYLHEGGALRVVASHNVPAAFAEARRRGPFDPASGSPSGEVIRTKQTVHLADLAATQAYAERHPHVVEAVELGGVRTVVAVPMLKDNELIGIISIFRQEVRPFTDKQVALLTSFASQAVIAIENTRLLNELRESLQQQTATADVLKVISRSTFDLQSVLNTLVESAVRLCEADMGSINRQHGEFFRQVANYGHSTELEAFMDTHPIPSGRGSIVGRTVLEGGTVHVDDVLAEPDYRMSDAARIGGIRTMLGVPLLREGMPIGVIVLQRKTVGPFTDKQIELVMTFADQAVIAIENVRLFEAEQQRTRELSESLEQQTATSEVLGVISSSPGELEPVFHTMLANAVRITTPNSATCCCTKEVRFGW